MAWEGSVRPHQPQSHGRDDIELHDLVGELKWTNTVTVVMDITGDMMELSSIGFEWK